MTDRTETAIQDWQLTEAKLLARDLESCGQAEQDALMCDGGVTVKSLVNEVERLREAVLAVKGKLTCDVPDVPSALVYVERALSGSEGDPA